MHILRSIRREQRKIKSQMTKLESQLIALRAAAAALGSSVAQGVGKTPLKRRKLSAAGRLAISRAVKARWARLRATKKAA